MRILRGHSLIELLVVVVIISILLALLLPAVQTVRERARETVCKNNLHQMDLAMNLYRDVHKKLPGQSSPGQVGGWFVEILPFVEQRNLSNSVNVGLSLNRVPAILRKPPSIFRCPRREMESEPLPTDIWPAHYVMAPNSKREFCLLFDAPISLNVPWLVGPELTNDELRKSTGPHQGGFFYTNGSQHGVGFMLNGERID